MSDERFVFMGDLTPYRDTISTTRKKQYQRLLEQADRYQGMTLSKVHPKESTTWMGVAIMNLALAYRLSGKEQYLADSKRFMETVLGYEKWGNAYLVNVDLSASWILFGLSLGYDWLKPFLTEDEKSRIQAKMRHHAQILLDYRRANYGKGWSTNFFQNHNWINMTGLATAGYALQGECPEAETYIQESKDDFARVYSLMAEDGSNYEGVCYWRYGGMWLFVYAHLLKTQEGIDYFKTCPYLQNTFFYRLYQSNGDLHCQLNFGDCHDYHSSHPACVYYKVAAEYHEGHAQKLGNLVSQQWLMEEAENSGVRPGILPEAAFEFLWYDPAVEEREFDDLPLSRYFPDLGLLCLRDSWAPTGKVFSIKCGAPGGNRQWEKAWQMIREEDIFPLSLSHHHPDNLAYIFARGDEYFSCDDGFNRNIMPDNHSVLLVDGVYTDAADVGDVYMDSVRQRQEELGDAFDPAAYEGHVTGLEMKDGLVLYRGETSGVYPAEQEMREVSRLFLTDSLKFWVLVDVFTCERPHTYAALCNTTMKGQAERGAYRYPMRSGAIRHQVFSNRPTFDQQYDQQVVSVMTPQEPDKLTQMHIETLRTESAEPVKDQVFFETFTFEGTDAQIKAKGKTLTVVCEGKSYLVEVGSYDPAAQKTPITVTVDGDRYEM